ncbi:MAG: DUF1015 domain-containing protein [Saprospiraceae bacterium]|nr:DUF1015 domain-containing protein [Pyrinomonadaceae bacterium]
MSIIKPFRALRPAPEKAGQVSCVPYDVPYESEVRDIIQKNPLSFLHVTRSEAEFAEGENPDKAAIVHRAKVNLQRFIDNGTLSAEAEPSLYVYRLATDSQVQTGIVVCASLDEYKHGLIKKHEKTRPDKVEDRTSHMLALRAQTGLIFLAFHGTDQIRDLIEKTTAGEPLYDFACDNDVRQTVWRVERADEAVEAFADVAALYIADGHHRAESAFRARETLKAANPDHTGNEDYNFVVAGIFPAEDLRIMAYNRVVKDLNGLSVDEFLTGLKNSFTVTGDGVKYPSSRGNFSMYLGDKWYTLTFTEGFAQDADPRERLDVSILQKRILEPILAIGDPRTDSRIAFVGGARGAEELEKLVDEGEMAVAFSLFPTMMEDLFAVSDAGEIMPPKSTWFEPKLKDGLFVHLI